MIVVSLPRNKVRTVAKSFQCARCNVDFYVRHKTGSTTLCIECAYVRDAAKFRAIHKVKRAIKAGDLQPPNKFKCADCDAPADRYDHRDYSKQLEVTPVCCSCNGRRGPALLGEK